MIFVNKDYQVINATVKELVAESDDAFIKDLLNRVEAKHFFQNPSDKRPMAGITMLSGYPMFISLSPVTTTDGTAPGNGFLVIGRYLNQSFINYMEDVLQVKISIAAPQDQKSMNSQGIGIQLTSINGEDISVEKNKASIKSHSKIDDILNEQSIPIEFDLERELYKNGLYAVQYFGGIYLIALLIVAALCIYVFDSLITHRISKLYNFIDNVSASKDTTARISEHGKDEISRLAANMNNMLGELDNSYAELKKRDERFRCIMEATNDGYFDANMKSDEIYISPSWLNYLGYNETSDYINSQRHIDNIFPGDMEIYKSAFDQYIKGETEHFRVECRMKKNTGEWLWTVVRGRMVEFDDAGKPLRLIGTISDITERKKYEAENLYLMQTDPITTLKNRAYMERMLKVADQCSECECWLIMGDVNGLKIVNDSLGHRQGDSLLRTIGEILVRCCSEGEIPARWGGDEFLILVRDRDAAYVEKLIQRIKTECEQVINNPFKISIAMGSARKDERHTDSDAVLKLAEERMYRNKLLESRSTRSAIIFSLEQSLHEKHFETEEHTKRIQHMCVQIGKSLGLSQEELDELALLGILHDIGKIAIPEVILLKPDKLTNEEWEVMKTHTEIGYRIAASSPELAHIADEILCHHERYDGTGYPQGLVGKDIPKLSRLLSIADSFDVMTHDRVYKKAMSFANAVEELKSCSGKQFDPEMVEAFLKLLYEHSIDINIEESITLSFQGRENAFVIL